MADTYLRESRSPPDRRGCAEGHGNGVPNYTPKGYDFSHCCRFLRRLGITLQIARSGFDGSERLDHQRWVVEHTLASLHRFHRLTIRYEHRPDIHEAFHWRRARICLHHVE